MISIFRLISVWTRRSVECTSAVIWFWITLIRQLEPSKCSTQLSHCQGCWLLVHPWVVLFKLIFTDVSGFNGVTGLPGPVGSAGAPGPTPTGSPDHLTSMKFVKCNRDSKMVASITGLRLWPRWPSLYSHDTTWPEKRKSNMATISSAKTCFHMLAQV